MGLLGLTFREVSVWVWVGMEHGWRLCFFFFFRIRGMSGLGVGLAGKGTLGRGWRGGKRTALIRRILLLANMNRADTCPKLIVGDIDDGIDMKR